MSVNKEDIERYKQDAVAFVTEVLGYELRPWQQELLQAHSEGKVVVLQGPRYGRLHTQELYLKWQEWRQKHELEPPAT